MSINSNKNCFFQYPMSFIYNDVERMRFKNYQDELAKEIKLDKVWRCYSNDFFPIDPDIYIEFTDDLSPSNMEEFVQKCNIIKAPVILEEIFCFVEKKYGMKFLLDFLVKAPVCTKKNNRCEVVWDTISFAAPIMLNFLFQKKSCKNDELKNVLEEYKSYFLEICKVLLKRKDGDFLAWNYVKYLLTSKKNIAYTSTVIDSIGDTFSSLFREKYSGTDWLKKVRPKGFSLSNNRKRFNETGLLGITGKDSMFLNILTQMQFYEKEKIGEYIPCFEDAILLEDDQFMSFSKKPLLCHLYIANIYLSQKNYIESWISTWEKMSPARYRIQFNRYDDFSMGIERNLNFLLLVGIAMIEKLFHADSNEEFKNGNCLCDTLLSFLTDIVKCRGRMVSMLNQEMFDYVMTWKYIYEKKNSGGECASHAIIDYVLTQNVNPRRTLEMLLLLKANGFSLFFNSNTDRVITFRDYVIDAADFAIAQEGSEYKLAKLGKNIKSWIMHQI